MRGTVIDFESCHTEHTETYLSYTNGSLDVFAHLESVREILIAAIDLFLFPTKLSFSYQLESDWLRWCENCLVRIQLSTGRQVQDKQCTSGEWLETSTVPVEVTDRRRLSMYHCPLGGYHSTYNNSPAGYHSTCKSLPDGYNSTCNIRPGGHHSTCDSPPCGYHSTCDSPPGGYHSTCDSPPGGNIIYYCTIEQWSTIVP